MPVNNNPYSGQPTYSRDVTLLMRRINALEALTSAPAGTFGGNTLLDFDVYDGRLYALVYQFDRGSGRPGNHRIKVHDATTGAPIYDFAVPVEVASSAGNISIQNRDLLAPRMCVGDGWIYMVYLVRAMENNPEQFSRHVAGAIVRFSLNGDGLETKEWEEYETELWRKQQPNQPVVFVQDTTITKALAPGSRRYTNVPQGVYYDFIAQMHFVDGWVYAGLCGGTTGPTNYNTSIGSHESEVNQLVVASADFSSADWVSSYRELKDENSLWYLVFRPYWHMGNTFSPYSQGAFCPWDGKLYLDGGGEQPHFEQGNVLASVMFTSVPATGGGEIQQEFLHAEFDTFDKHRPALGVEATTMRADLYATDGVSLLAREQYEISPGSYRYRLRRYDLYTGVFVEDLYLDDGTTTAAPTAMRYADGYIWLGYGGGDRFGVAVQSRIDVRDPVTWALVLSFLIGDPVPQTEWEAWTTGGRTSLGEPDGGVSVPELEVLATNGAQKNGDLIVQMRNALRRLAPFFLAPSGERLHLNGSEDGDNLYFVAMGDRSNYGATGGALADFTRADARLWNPGYYQVEGVYYRVLKDHVGSAENKPGVGGQWEEFWRSASADEALAAGAFVGEWVEGGFFNLGKTYDIDIGEVLECVTILEGSPLASAPTGGV